MLYQNNVRIHQIDKFLGHLIVTWTIFHFFYERFLNSLLRCMRFPLVQRTRIIQALWYCGFAFGSICYIQLSTLEFFNATNSQTKLAYHNFGMVLHKSFYFHLAGLDILNYGQWNKGFCHIFFAISILNFHAPRWYKEIKRILFVKAIDIMILNTCCIAMCLQKSKKGGTIVKILFWLHFFNWAYMFVDIVPKFIFQTNKIDHPLPECSLWLWFLLECLNSVWLKLLMRTQSKNWLETILFPPLTQEAMKLQTIYEKHQETLKKIRTPSNQNKAELWQTLLCVAAMKKKIKRIRQAKLENSLKEQTKQ